MSGNEPADIPFTRWRATDIPFETESFPVPPNVARKKDAAPEATDQRTATNEKGKAGSDSPPAKDSLGIAHSVTAGGIAASHIEVPLAQVMVAPTLSSKEVNSIKQSIVPLACWRAQDMRFEFESSFVLPEITTEIGALKELIDRHTLTNERGEAEHKPPLTVFGHADPTGDDDFNKALSGRRAQALYALLTRKVELWEDLHSNPLGNDKWEPKATQRMQTTLGLPVTGKLSRGERAALFKAYMEHVCTARDEKGQALLDDGGRPIKLELKPSDFLADGADPGGKGDFQGCGEFNPILMFSAAENRDFSDPKRKDKRDKENAPNRRVLIFLFRPGVRVKPDGWPCPRAKEGSAACKKRFWSDAAKRRTFQEKRREFKDDQDTFACRFYDRLSNNSPCERGLATFRIRLYDPAGKALRGAPFEVQVGLRKPTPVANADDTGVVVVQDLEVPNRCVVRWGFPPSKEGEKPKLVFTLDMFLTHDNLSNKEEAKQKLHNLGYVNENDPIDNVAAFQRDYGRLATPPLEVFDGNLDDRTMKLLRAVYDQCAEDLRNTPPRQDPVA